MSYIRTDEQKAYLSKLRKGKKLSLKIRKKMSETRARKYKSGELIHPMKKHFLSKEQIERELKKEGNQYRAAANLGCSQMTISRLCRKYDIQFDGRMEREPQTRGKKAKINGVWMRSSWEYEFANDLNEKGIIWKYESKRFKLKDGRFYTPDFYLPETNEFIEIKGHWYPAALEKYKLFRKQFKEIKIKQLS